MSCPGHLVLCDRMYHEDSWATSWFLVLNTRKIRIVHFGAELSFEIKVVSPSLGQQRQYLSFSPFERVLGKCLEVYTGKLETLAAITLSFDCSGDFYFTCLLGLWKESKSAVCQNGWQECEHWWGSKWETYRNTQGGGGAVTVTELLLVSSILPSWTKGFIKSFIMQNNLNST